MRKIIPSILNKGRIRTGPWGSNNDSGLTGAFEIKGPSCKILIISGKGNREIPWEHVSVSLPGQKRCPTWEEMCYVKDWFWSEEETVIQFHPPKSKYIRRHPYVLHLWKPLDYKIILPPEITI